MLHIKDFVNKVTLGETKRNNNVVLSIDQARGLKDELVMLLSDLHELKKEKNNEETVDVQVKGGSFKWVEANHMLY